MKTSRPRKGATDDYTEPENRPPKTEETIETYTQTTDNKLFETERGTHAQKPQAASRENHTTVG